MPRIFKIGPYWIYFWANENKPLEPIHVHVAEGKPVEKATKIWITQTGTLRPVFISPYNLIIVNKA